jgi:hypothetical protein
LVYRIVCEYILNAVSNYFSIVDTDPDADASGEYPGLLRNEGGPTRLARQAWSSPIALFFFFLPRQLWHIVARESNRYMQQSIPAWAEALNAKQKKRKATNPAAVVETRKSIRERLRVTPKVEAHEIVHVLGLLVARTLCPHKRRFASHWSTTAVGAIPKRKFGAFMPRNRYDLHLYCLYVVSNKYYSIGSTRSCDVSILPTTKTLVR